MALSLRPEALGLTRGAGMSVWGVVMDTVMVDGTWHCLVIFADGTTSLYTSAVFGVIGAGGHPRVRQASDALLRGAESELGLFGPARNPDLPGAGQVAIRALTANGHLVVTASEDDLGHGRNPWNPLFHAAHEVITEVRTAAPE